MSNLYPAKGITVPGETVQKLIKLGNGDAALLYLWMLKNGGHFSSDDASAELSRPRTQIDAALSALAAAGLLTTAAPAAPEYDADEIPEHTAADIKNELQNDPEFGLLVNEVQTMLGRVFSSSDLIKFFGIYNDLHLPPAVLLQLIGHCIEACRMKYGSGRPPTMRYIEKAAFTWEREGIFTIEAAESYLKRLAAFRSAEDEIKSVLGIRDRRFSPSEQKYVDSWLSMGFGPDAVEIAHDRTVLKTGKVSWGYMNSIFKSWHEKGLHTRDEIISGDTRPAKPQTAQTDQPKGPSAADMERMKRMLRRIDEQEN